MDDLRCFKSGQKFTRQDKNSQQPKFSTTSKKERPISILLNTLLKNLEQHQINSIDEAIVFRK